LTPLDYVQVETVVGNVDDSASADRIRASVVAVIAVVYHIDPLNHIGIGSLRICETITRQGAQRVTYDCRWG